MVGQCSGVAGFALSFIINLYRPSWRACLIGLQAEPAIMIAVSLILAAVRSQLENFNNDL